MVAAHGGRLARAGVRFEVVRDLTGLRVQGRVPRGELPDLGDVSHTPGLGQPVEDVALLAREHAQLRGLRCDLGGSVQLLQGLEDRLLEGGHDPVPAGREIRVIVRPKEVDDDAAVLLSHEIAREIEDQLEYPGQIKVTVIRESRAIEIAK